MTKKDVESMNEYKHSDELKKLIVRLGSNISLGDNSKKIVILRLFDELYYKVKKYNFVSMTDDEYHSWYVLLNNELDEEVTELY